MRRTAGILLLAGSGACASKQSAPELAPTPQVATATVQPGVNSASTSLTLANTAAATKDVVAMPIDKAWAALDKAYTIMTIKPTERDGGHYTLASTGFKARRKLGDVPLMRALDCGGDSSTPNAETYEITLSVRTRLSPDGAGGTLVQSLVEGVGRNSLTNNSNQVPCYSSGGIEKRIIELVKQAGTDKNGAVVAPVKKGGGL